VRENLPDGTRARTTGADVTSPALANTWLRRQVPSWLCMLGVCAFALAALVEGAGAWATALCAILLVVDGVVALGVASVLVRYRRQIFAAAILDDAAAESERRAFDPSHAATARRFVRWEGLVLGALCVFAGLDAAYTVHPVAVGVALLLFGVQLLYDRHRRARR
jgi:hypothetical protein